MCDRWRAHNYSLVGAIFRLEGNDQQWQVVRMASSRLDHRQHPQILAVPFPSRGITMPTTLDLSQARFGSKWQPLPPDLVLTIREGDDPHSSDMDISDDDRQTPSSAGSCLQTHPPPQQLTWSPDSPVDTLEGGDFNLTNLITVPAVVNDSADRNCSTIRLNDEKLHIQLPPTSCPQWLSNPRYSSAVRFQ